MKNDWFTSWFNTHYYHILYKNRNNADAEFFMRNIVTFLSLPKGSKIADIPCGKGRHSIFLNSMGYEVFGGDLSINNINFAKRFENKTLNFEVCDMRNPLKSKYNAVFNLFTSFGYFKDDKEDIAVLQSFKSVLKKDGILVLDFLNVEKVKNNLIKNEVKQIDGIQFNIKREINNGFILKHIKFTDKGKDYKFTERVKFLDIDKFKSYFLKVGFSVEYIFGDYNLSTFNKKTSNRLILVAK